MPDVKPEPRVRPLWKVDGASRAATDALIKSTSALSLALPDVRLERGAGISKHRILPIDQGADGPPLLLLIEVKATVMDRPDDWVPCAYTVAIGASP